MGADDRRDSDDVADPETVLPSTDVTRIGIAVVGCLADISAAADVGRGQHGDLTATFDMDLIIDGIGICAYSALRAPRAGPAPVRAPSTASRR